MSKDNKDLFKSATMTTSERKEDTLKKIAELANEEKTAGGAMRKNTGKLQLSLAPEEAQIAMAQVFMQGLDKYPRFNYRLGFDWLSPSDSLERHLLKWKMGEDIDPESGLPHVYHIISNAAIMVYNCEHFPELDDRCKTRPKRKENNDSDNS